MARIASLSVLLTDEGNDFLAEQYGKVIENIEKTTISGALKNTDLSGTPTSGSVEAKRFTNWEVFFGFSEQNELIYVKHSLIDESFDFENNKYNQTFLEILEKMKSKYGAPISDDEKWHNEKYKDDAYMINKAINDGDYTRKIKWKLDGHFCSLKLDEGIKIAYCINEENV